MRAKVTKKQLEKVQGMSLREAAKVLGVGKDAVSNARKRFNSDITVKVDYPENEIESLSKQLEQANEKVNSLIRMHRSSVNVKKTSENTFKFGIISDTHVGSLYYNPAKMVSFLEHCYEQGITDIIHAGDVFEGSKMRPGHDTELQDHGLDAQMERLWKTWPHGLGMNVEFITGNHDLVYKRQAGVDVGSMISDEMGWGNLGEGYGNITYNANGHDYKICVLHPGDGSSYALSYKPQKIIESWEGGDKPNMLVIGHYHKMVVMPSYRNVTAVLAGTFQNQSAWMRSKSLAAHIGGYIVEVTVGGEEMFNIPAFSPVCFY